MNKIKIGFICVHNSCRSQMAEAVANIKYKNLDFEFYSAGTHLKPQINQDAVAVIKEIYDFDMNETQKNKLLDQIPELDVVITMGCNVNCPLLPCKFREDWGLDDPSGKNKEEFIKTHNLIVEKLDNLILRINNKEITL